MNKEDKKILERVENKVDDIRDNHLLHIYESLGKLNGHWSIIIPLIICMLALIGGLYALIVTCLI